MGQFESCGHPEARAVTSFQETEMLFPGEGGDTGQESPHLTLLGLTACVQVPEVRAGLARTGGVAQIPSASLSPSRCGGRGSLLVHSQTFKESSLALRAGGSRVQSLVLALLKLRVRQRRPCRKFLVEMLWPERAAEPSVMSQPGAGPQGSESHLCA